jgi:uncharacterized protein YbcV (DUF1398 family)
MLFDFCINHYAMFTIQEITAAHRKVKSGADFPAYIQDIKKLGVTQYETFVDDGHTNYYGQNEHSTSTLARYAVLPVSEEVNAAQFKIDLKAHQQGLTNYDSFIRSCAKFGIARWIVRIHEMTCTYYDKKGNEILVEEIPD